MAICPNCGSATEGRYCAKCGTAIEGGAAQPVSSASAVGAPAISENIASALCYALGLITGILFLALPPYNQNRTIRFHAWQSIFLHVAILVIFMVIMPFMPWAVAVTLGPLLGLGSFILWLLLMWKAYNNQRLVIPVIGEFAQKQA